MDDERDIPKVGDEVGEPVEGDDELDPDVPNDAVPEPAQPDLPEDDGSTTEPEA